MSLPWSKQDNEWILAQREDRMRQAPRQCSEIEVMAELAALYSTGRLAKMEKSPLARSFGWTRWKLMRRLEAWALADAMPWLDLSPTASAQTPHWWPAGEAEESREDTSDDRQQAHSKRTASAPSRARSSSESKKETKSETADRDSIWTRFAESYQHHSKGTLVQTLYLPNLKSHCKRHGADVVLAAWHWACTSTSAENWHRAKLKGAKLPQAFCRKDGKTFAAIVANRDAEGEPSTPSQIDPSAIFDRFSQAAKRLGHTATPDPDAIHPDRPTALRAWDCLKASGGWVSLCNANPYEVSQMRRSFIQSWGIAA